MYRAFIYTRPDWLTDAMLVGMAHEAGVPIARMRRNCRVRGKHGRMPTAQARKLARQRKRQGPHETGRLRCDLTNHETGERIGCGHEWDGRWPVGARYSFGPCPECGVTAFLPPRAERRREP